MKNLLAFKNKNLLEEAFTHRSYLNETKEKINSNERLEFLGDSILSFFVSQYLFKKYSEYDEGTLTNIRSNLVNTKTLGQIAKSLDFGKYLRLSRGEIEAKGRENQSILANSFESYIGGLYLDQGTKAVYSFLKETLFPKVEEIVKSKAFKDPKSLLQENIQAQKLASPIYKVLIEEGPAHARIFTIGVYINNQLVEKGIGHSKQEAEENAAQLALEKIQK